MLCCSMTDILYLSTIRESMNVYSVPQYTDTQQAFITTVFHISVSSSEHSRQKHTHTHTHTEE
jgi:hypothetical protein